MPNLMDNAPFHVQPQTVDPVQALQQALQQARQNPAAFEEQLRRTNPQAYQQAMQIRNSGNPQAAIMQMLQARGINPNVLHMLGIK